jgi:hypothetical protein
MSRLLRFALLGLVSALQACASNDVVPITLQDVTTPQPGRAIAIFGIDVQARWTAPRFAVTLAEYDIQRKAITGNCSRFNHMQASIEATTRQTTYFAFNLRPGFYAYGPFSAVSLKGELNTFEVPANRMVYIGDFVLTTEQSVELRRADTERVSLREAGPVDGVVLAKATVMPSAQPFLCAP